MDSRSPLESRARECPLGQVGSEGIVGELWHSCSLQVPRRRVRTVCKVVNPVATVRMTLSVVAYGEGDSLVW